MAMSDTSYTIFCRINAPGAEAGNEPFSCLVSMKLGVWTPGSTLTLSGENMIQFGLIVPEIWPVKVKSRGHVYSSRHVHLVKYLKCFPQSH